MTAHLPELWVIASVAAAAFQTLRFMLQKALSVATLTPTGATFARFLYSAPVILICLIGYLVVQGRSVPDIGAAFWLFAPVGGVAQVLATVCLVTLFKSRNFAVGLTLIKTEVIFTTLIGFIVLGDLVTIASFLAILLGVAGVLLLSSPPDVAGWEWRTMWNRSVFLGLAAGVLFGISAVSYRGASLLVESEDAALRAAFTLSAVTAMQMVGMSFWLYLKDRPQLKAVWLARRKAIWIGLMSLAGSFCWFYAFTLQNAAYVKAVGQIELVFGLIASIAFFSERITLREIIGMFVLCGSILMLVLLA